jgi:anti-sigma-K factor RskA
MTAFWTMFAAALAAGAVLAGVVAMTLKVRRYNRNLAEIRRIADAYHMQSPWWKRWYQPYERWDRRWS